MLREVKEFCREHHWMTGIHEFLQAWGPQKLESMRGCPIKNYVMLVSCLNVWQTRVSNIPNKLVTKGRLMLLSCHHVQLEMGECFLSSFLPPSLSYPHGPPWAWNVLQGLLVKAPHWTYRTSKKPGLRPFPLQLKVWLLQKIGSAHSPYFLGVTFLSPDTFYFFVMEVVQTKYD